MSERNIKTRFAPSPTGYLHVGGLRTALYNYLFARQNGGKFALRIEDTDRSRLMPGAEENILKTLQDFGLDFDEGPFKQSENLEKYREYTGKLLNQGLAYEQEGAVRFKMPKDGLTKFRDIIRGEIEMENKLQEDFVILKSDGFPTYNLAHLVDDHDMGVTHVIRGEEFISSMPKYIALHDAFGWEPPEYAHLPLLLNKDRAKLSKREGEMAVYDFLDKGYLKEAVLNFVALLGWHPSESDQEIFTLKELVKEFKLENVQKAGAIFDIQKLDWVNREHIKNMPMSSLLERVKEYGERDQSFKVESMKLKEEKVSKILELERPRLTTFSELPKIFAMFGAQPEYDAPLLKWKDMPNDEVKHSLERASEIISGFDEEIPKAEIEKVFLKEIGKGDKGTILWPLRAALSGKKASPSPFEMVEILGKKEALGRITYAIQLVSKN